MKVAEERNVARLSYFPVLIPLAWENGLRLVKRVYAVHNIASALVWFYHHPHVLYIEIVLEAVILIWQGRRKSG